MIGALSNRSLVCVFLFICVFQFREHVASRRLSEHSDELGVCGHAFNELRTRPELKDRGRKRRRERDGREKDEHYNLEYLFLSRAEVNLLCQLPLSPSEQYVPWRKCHYLSGRVGTSASHRSMALARSCSDQQRLLLIWVCLDAFDMQVNRKEVVAFC